ncbi:MAG: glycosyltransferase [Chthoniobacteraceae bacterium]
MPVAPTPDTLASLAGDAALLHVILTRFNVPIGGREKAIRMQGAWLSERFALFSDFCLPSVLDQTCKKFKWIIFFDRETPGEFKERIREFSAGNDQIVPYFVESWSAEIVRAAIDSVRATSHRWLLSSRLDNDDAIHERFIESLQTNLQPESFEYYNFPDGLIYANERLYSWEDRSNAFLSRLEPIEGFKTAWELQHPDVIRLHRVKQLGLRNAWVQNVHGTNVSNKIRGRLVRRGTWPDGYSGAPKAPLRDPGNVAFLQDRMVLHPWREFRDSAITVIKAMKRRCQMPGGSRTGGR